MNRVAEEGLEIFLYVAPVVVFKELKSFFEAVPESFTEPVRLRKAAVGPLETYIHQQGGFDVLEKIRCNSASQDHFLTAVHGWMDSLKLVRYIRMRFKTLGGEWIYTVLSELLQETGFEENLEG